MTTTNMSTLFFSLLLFKVSLNFFVHLLLILPVVLQSSFLRSFLPVASNLARALFLFFSRSLWENTYPSCLAASFCLQKSWGCFFGGESHLAVVVVAKGTLYTH
ncbi:hypothetical protein J3E72DRAFT_319361 [Bipolaris maydis]|uniref:uncharacterized protein n=1 Tax=Cochliobolus heterostrophus TaxID=5016 RepID=UPI0024D8B339|nr:hypothetical protein J3E73DRAFT_352741 [Bipolaris maydis]KAJ5061311.1 hypothetical protein J3E74DRAFT_339423 [Bipolaris maydis]KAJ6198440.1 hypothetical protein J3E72DRAFT_319361 [Bipolaris maydis]KAJ6210581.1 hypothetical protein PSV09DRAFT_2304854 [Bipolaris maydis]KAJ6271894.1 hypothetical protein PSV08DRAFT_285956 [Bipolaris maydis]